jgi:hypothetical protein
VLYSYVGLMYNNQASPARLCNQLGQRVVWYVQTLCVLGDKRAALVSAQTCPVTVLEVRWQGTGERSSGIPSAHQARRLIESKQAGKQASPASLSDLPFYGPPYASSKFHAFLGIVQGHLGSDQATELYGMSKSPWSKFRRLCQ